jgi:lambda repressor-like predicted transcriptional regulator
MKCAVKRRGFCPAEIKQLALQSGHAVWAVVCLANESCAIGDEYPSTLRNYLTRSFRKYAQIYGAFVDLRSGEVIPRSSVNRRYNNRHSYEVYRLEIKREILRQLERRLWRYLYEMELKLWITGLEDE